MHIYSAILIRTLEYFNWNKIKHDPTFSLTFSVSLQNCYMVSHKVHLNMNFTDLSQCPSLYLPLWDIKFMNVVLSGRSEYILPLLSIPHFIISQCHAYWFFHILVLRIIISSTSLPSGTILLYFTHVHTYKALAFIRRKNITATYSDSRWITVTYQIHCFLMKYFFHWITETDVQAPPCKIFFYHLSEKGKEAVL